MGSFSRFCCIIYADPRGSAFLRLGAPTPDVRNRKNKKAKGERKMKKQLKRILAAALILALSLLALISCNPQSASGECTVIIGAKDSHKEYTINLDEVEITEGVLSLVKYLEEKEGLEAEYTDSGYGAYFTSIDTLIPEITAEKYEVPKEKAVSQGPTDLPPSTKPLTSVAFFLQ